MIEVSGDLWTYPAEVRVITTNGSVLSNGRAVMGAGCAKEAAIKWPDLPAIFGYALTTIGNICQVISTDPIIVAFPVKNNWRRLASLELIDRSAIQLRRLTEQWQWKSIVMPRPGCGFGGLQWANVKPVIEPILDDRFHVITWSGQEESI